MTQMEQGRLVDAICRADRAALAEMLVHHPEWIEGVDAGGTPLYLYAGEAGDLALLRYVVEYTRASLSSVDAANRGILHYAARSGAVDCCRYLVERAGMDPLRPDSALQTPYDVARACGHAALEAYFQGVVGAPLDAMYRNPIRRGMFPDPSIVRVGEDYYMVNSSFVFFPCIPISHSRDLVHWRIIGHAITVPQWAALDGLEGGRGYWAPDISYHDGLFYICATYRMNDGGPICRRQMVVTATRPQGPYSQPVFFDEDGIDPSIFHDDDGRHYMLLNRGARIFEIDATATRRLGEATLLYYGDHKRAPEGPHLLKKDGWYYLFLAEGGTGPGHRESVARARTLMGPYAPCPHNPILRQWDEGALLQRCGHAKPVCTQHGDWYLVYLCGRQLGGRYTLMGRETALDPITWTADGWPLVNGGRGPSALQIWPPGLAPAQAGEGDGWMTPRAPDSGEIVREGDTVTICGSEYPLRDVRCRSLLVRRQTALRCTFETTVRPRMLPPDGEAGITCYYDEYSFLTFGIVRGAEGLCLRVREQIGLEERLHAPAPLPMEAGGALRLRVETDGLTRRLCWAVGNAPFAEALALEDVTYLSDEGVRIGKRFTGAMVGVYALGGTVAAFVGNAYWEGGGAP